MTVTEPALTTPSMRLDGKIAMITGAGRGLGRACALALAQAGAEVALVSRTRSELEALAAEIQQDGGKAIPVLGIRGQVDQFVRVALQVVEFFRRAAGSEGS